MKVLIVLLGILAALATGGLVLFTAGEIPAAIVFLVVLGIAGAGVYLSGTASTGILAVLGLLFVGAVGYGGFSGYQRLSAVLSADGHLGAR